MRKLIIPVWKWLHGARDSDGGCNSYLLRPDDEKQCCLGFYLEACGVSRNRLAGKREPRELHGVPAEAEWTVSDSETVLKLMDINDGSAGGRVNRKLIAKLFKQKGVEVEFV